jgi:tetratricopeptide (TPR) repeat protein
MTNLPFLFCYNQLNMPLSLKQKQFILNNFQSKKNSEMAEFLKISIEDVEEYLSKRRLSKKEHSNDKNKTISYKLENIFYISVIAILAILLYFKTLNHELVSDDIEVIINNEQILKSGEYLWSNNVAFLRNLQYVISYQLGGLSPFFYRLFNILFHFGFATVTMFIIKRFTKEKYLPFLVALIVVVHPMMIESVAWISGGIYAQAAFFTGLSFYFYLRFKESSKIWNYICSLLFFFIGVTSSEKVIVFPFIVALYEILFGKFKKSFLYLMPFFAISLVMGLIAARGISARLDYLMVANGTNQRYNFSNPFIQIPAALTSYFHLFIWPDKLNLYQSDIAITPFTILRNGLVTIIYFLILTYTFLRNKAIFFFLSFFFISLLITLNPFGLSWVFAERYSYFGSIGIYFALVYGVIKFFSYLKARSVSFVILTLVIIGLSLRTLIRLDDWKNEETLWTATVKYAKTDAKSHNNLGHVLAKRGDINGAMTSFSNAISLSPGYADPYHNLGNMYLYVGDFDKAEEIYLKATELNPNLWQSHQNLASIYLRRKEFQKSEPYFQKSISINPQNAGGYFGLAIIFSEVGDIAKAQKYLREALKIDPNHEQAKDLLSKITNK